MKRTMLGLMALALVGCPKGPGPTTPPDEATEPGAGGEEAGEPEGEIPDDEEAGEGDEPY